MATLESEVLGRFNRSPSPAVGPVTAGRFRRNLLVYAVVVCLSIAPTLLNLSPGWQATGLGLFVPGGGFLALGGWGVLLLALTLGAFWLSCIAWFWTGAVVAPLFVWLGSALISGALVGDSVWAPAAWLAPLAAASVYGFFKYREQTRRAADHSRYAARQAFYPESRAEVEARVTNAETIVGAELQPRQLSALRYVFERALQPLDEFKGFTIIDQFQPAALRYQLNHLGYALAQSQTHYTPNFAGYLNLAQRNLIEKYLNPRVWSYWVLESMWGHFNFSNFDPAAKDNIMLTGYLGMQVNAYMLASGDRRYAEPGSLTFRLNERTAYPHSSHTLAQSVLDNLGRSDFCLYPCEPNWIYPVCNMYGMSSLAAHDAVFGTQYVPRMLPQWMANLEREFTDEKGSLIGLRSYWTGHDISIFNSEAGFAFFANIFSTALGRRLWAVGRKELSFCLAEDKDCKPRLTFPPGSLTFLDTIDVGHYRRGLLFGYAAVAICAREFGDDELAEAALRSMDQDCGLVDEDGVTYYRDASGLANAWALEAQLLRTNFFRNTFVQGPPECTRTGPLLTEAGYPEVLVAKAFSHGADLELVLYPGRQGGPQTLGLSRLQPGRTYQVTGAAVPTIQADAEGCTSLQVNLMGRTVVQIT